MSKPPDVGPPTEPRRSTVRYNATKHAILSTSPVVPWVETEEDWLEFRDGFFSSIQPEDDLQCYLTDRAAGLMWRLQRAVRHEREAVTDNMRQIQRDIMLGAHITGEPAPDPGTPEYKRHVDSVAMARLIPDEQTLAVLGPYESRLHRHLIQTLRMIALHKKWTESFGSDRADRAAKLTTLRDPHYFN
jgi:hypothetical protein